METKIVIPSEKTIAQAAELLNAGEIIAFPTETVYGLGANVFNPQAIQKIFDVKGRPSDNPLITHISALSQVELLAEDVPQLFYDLANAFFPGPLTLVVQKKKTVPEIASAQLPTIGIRMPNHPVAWKLIDCSRTPLVAPSANISGRPSPTRAAHVLEDLNGKIPLILDSGPCGVGIESTVLDLTVSPPTILRPGHITKEQLETALGGLPLLLPETYESTNIAKAPGMKYRHYAPKARIQLTYSLLETEKIIQTLSPATTWILSNVHLPATLLSFPIKPITEQTLYATFRDADNQHISKLIIYLDNETKQNKGLTNRIQKAANS